MRRDRYHYAPVSRFPRVKRDLSVTVPDDSPAGLMESTLKKTCPELVKSVILYDMYRGGQVPEGKKSMTYSIVFQSDTKTLSDEDVNREMEKIVGRLKSEFHAELRS